MFLILLRLNVVYALALDIECEARQQLIIEMLVQNFDACCMAKSH